MYRYELNEDPGQTQLQFIAKPCYVCGTLHVSAREGIHRALYKYKNI